MPNTTENQFWLVQDKVDFETLKDKVIFIEQNYLLDIDYSIKSKLNSNGINDKHIEFTSVFETINNIKLQLNLLRTNLKPLKKRIIKNLESKKINFFKNFVIRFFTFGKINRNRDIKNEISNFNFNYQDIKKKCENFVEKLNTKENELLCEIEKRHYDLKLERDQLKQINYKLETIIRNNKEKIKELESNMQENQNKISKLEQENQERMNFIDSKNIRFYSQCVTLENIIRSQKEEIDFHMKQNHDLKQEIKLRDSGIKSASGVFDSDIDSFNKDKINVEQNKQHMTKKRIKARIVQIN
ncbi:hypothetical protein [Spiroplasma ixodetis]|uniref:hypothetical protein n=1 Tax=Spiroplasma ixodetis TaxID=2141 RepID=UPI0025749517|nr:hypothetical protein [Spiroplasma ixodetis]WJG71440.1 hypothetical protein SIXOD_v1c28850 [Spiroplasma ixodetis Y32]